MTTTFLFTCGLCLNSHERIDWFARAVNKSLPRRCNGLERPFAGRSIWTTPTVFCALKRPALPLTLLHKRCARLASSTKNWRKTTKAGQICPALVVLNAHYYFTASAAAAASAAAMAPLFFSPYSSRCRSK